MKTALVIPCYNEALRLRREELVCLLGESELNLILVDDGSSDRTRELLHVLAEDLGDRVHVLVLPQNMGKAEAVRRGMNHGLALGCRHLGYLDADFATPAREMVRILDALRSDQSVYAVVGSRWLHMGARIERSHFRHYAGRVFATIASNILQMPIYDTQCGAKIFSVTPLLEVALTAPFVSRWAFDVELLGRLRFGIDHLPGYSLASFLELPLNEWRDVKGSKIGVTDMISATLELFLIGYRLRQTRTVKT